MSMPITILTQQELEGCVHLDQDALAAVEKAFGWISCGRAQLPPPLHLETTDPAGELDVKAAYVTGKPQFAVKIASGFFDNPGQGLPSGSGLMAVLSSRTGFCEAVLLDNGYLTDLRTALAGAVAARWLAPEVVATAGVIGTGAQAGYQLKALKLVRDFKRLCVFGRDSGKAQEFSHRLGLELGVEASSAASVAEVISESQCVVTATPSRSPLIEAGMLHPGLHITAMGSDHPGKQELEAEVLSRADLLVCDSISQASRIGELQHLGNGQAGRAIELGAITTGIRRGRTSNDQITVCDLTGIGTQDTAIALFALSRARQSGLGRRVE